MYQYFNINQYLFFEQNYYYQFSFYLNFFQTKFLLIVTNGQLHLQLKNITTNSITYLKKPNIPSSLYTVASEEKILLKK